MAVCSGASLLAFAYFVGIALVGAGLGALVAHVVWSQVRTADPPALLIVLVSIAGAIGAMILQRYVIIVGTAFGGAWTMIVGALVVAERRGNFRSPSSDAVWVLYPLSPATVSVWIPIAWVALGLVGTVVQLSVTATKRQRMK